MVPSCGGVETGRLINQKKRQKENREEEEEEEGERTKPDRKGDAKATRRLPNKGVRRKNFSSHGTEERRRSSDKYECSPKAKINSI